MIAWQNRPTYHQVVSFLAALGSDIANLAGRTTDDCDRQSVRESGRQRRGRQPTTRWGSSNSDSQTLTVDLDSTSTVAQTILRWEAAYGSSYRIDVSTNGSTWTSVWSTTAGNGGTDNNVFTAASARYVRMTGGKRATSYGYSLWEFEIYGR